MEIRANVNDPAANVANERTERSRSREAVPATSFRQAVEEANNDVVRVQRGDTLVSLTRQYLGDAATQLNKGQIYDLAKNLAKENGIHNPDRIMPGQQINMAPMSTLAALKLRQGGVEGVQMSEDSPRTAAPILEKTLARAVSKGYVPAQDQRAVREKILQLASRHGFSPDDFARTTLMESDGLNPRASNGSCHGIIQFCSGGNRGAASAGYAKNPKEILSLSVLQQLDLVDRYFADTRLKDYGPASLDNLYLTVLTPNARNETRPDAPLNIAGRQAAYLYEGRDPAGIITRNSLVNGLKLNARDRLSDVTVARVERKVM
jgi:LysM domain